MKFTSSPAYTMRPKTSNDDRYRGQPGVGSYNMDHHDIISEKKPKYSFGHAEKMKLREVTPQKLAPGCYETNNSTLSKKLAAPLRAQRDN
jgi:hypothetical protein